MFFSTHKKWSNIMVLNAFYALGIYFLELNWSGSFLLLTFYFADVIAKDLPAEETYINTYDLEEYNANYYSVYNIVLASISFVCLGYKDSYLLTLDIMFFLFTYLTSVYLWHTIFFIPLNGQLSWRRMILLSTTTLAILIASLYLLGWLIINFKGFTWFSPIITTPFFIIYDLIASLF